MDPLLARLANAIEDQELARLQRAFAKVSERDRAEGFAGASAGKVLARQAAFLRRLASLARVCSSVQPDGTALPERRCSNLLEQVRKAVRGRERVLSALSSDQRGFQTALEKEYRNAESLALIWALKLAGLVERKLEFIASVQRRPTARDLREEVAASMSIDDFVILKPISRGAHGRVYLAQVRKWVGCKGIGDC